MSYDIPNKKAGMNVYAEQSKARSNHRSSQVVDKSPQNRRCLSKIGASCIAFFECVIQKSPGIHEIYLGVCTIQRIEQLFFLHLFNDLSNGLFGTYFDIKLHLFDRHQNVGISLFV